LGAHEDVAARLSRFALRELHPVLEYGFTLRHVSTEPIWVPQACTLPTVEQPMRVAKFETLFATALRGQYRPVATRLRLVMDAAAEATARDLTAREMACCSFFTFTFTPADGEFVLDVEVPAAYIDVLDALAARAAVASGGADATAVLRPGQVAAAAGVNLQTLRYYERRGLLAKPLRTPGGHRQYPAETVKVLRVIKATQRLGFTLNEVADLLAAAGHGRGRREEAGLPAQAAAKLAEVTAKIADLQVIADTLNAALDAGCRDIVACAASLRCPLPFADVADGDSDADCR
jgi:MerR family mercuric resistance operon transcriptional regulator